MRLSIWILRYLSPKLESAQTQGTPSRTYCLGGLLLCGILKVSWSRAGHYRSAWDLRLQEALGSCSQGSHMPDARLYSLARLQQFSKNACNSKYFSLNRSVFADLGITGTFPDSSTPISSICPASVDGATPLTHRYTRDKESMLEWGYYPKVQGHKKWMWIIRSDLDPSMMFNRSWLTDSAGKW